MTRCALGPAFFFWHFPLDEDRWQPVDPFHQSPFFLGGVPRRSSCSCMCLPGMLVGARALGTVRYIIAELVRRNICLRLVVAGIRFAGPPASRSPGPAPVAAEPRRRAPPRARFLAEILTPLRDGKDGLLNMLLCFEVARGVEAQRLLAKVMPSSFIRQKIRRDYKCHVSFATFDIRDNHQDVLCFLKLRE